MKKFGEYITEGAPEGDKPKQVKPGDPDYNLVMKMRAKLGIDPTSDGNIDPKAIDQAALRRGTIKALGSKKFRRDMQDHAIADERLRRIDEVIQVNEYASAVMAAGRALLPSIGRGVASVGSAVGRGIMTAGRSATGAVQRVGGSVRTAVKKAVTPVKPGKDSTMGLAKKVVGQQIAKLPRGSAQQQLAARLASSGFKAAQSTPVQFALQKPMMTSAILGAGRRIRGNVSGRTQRGPEFR
jgi:hypothetical protein